MKQTYFISILLLLISTYCNFAQTCVAVPVVTLDPGGTGPIGAHMMVCYNPIKGVYYWNSGGFASNPIACHTSAGGNTVAVGLGNQDWRGLWWNSLTNSLEGNCFSSAGIFTVALNQLNGHPVGGSTIVSVNSQPSSQSGGQFDPNANQVLYYNSGQIFKYSRTSGNLLSTIVISGLPVGTGNLSNNGFYTGIPGMEYAVFDYINRRAYYVNYNTGAYVSTVQFPLSSGNPSSFGISYANGLFFIFNNTQWIGYAAGLNAIALPSSICPGSSTTLQALSANGFSWSTGSNASTIVVSPSVNTVYSVVSTPTAGCPSVMTLTINVHPLPTLTITGTNTVCMSSSINLTASGASSYTWNTGVVNASISVSPSVNTNYSVSGTSSLGCTNETSLSITVLSQPSLSIAGSTAVCPGSSITLNASGANTYTWFNGVNSSSVSDAPFLNTTYSVIGSGTNGCTSSANHSVVMLSSPSLAISGNSVCAGNSITLQASGASNYSWSTGSNNSSISVSPTMNTIYTVTGTSTLYPCGSTLTHTVQVIASPTVNTFSDFVCIGQTATLLASGASNYTWSTGAITNPAFANPSVTTVYTVTGQSVEGCVASNTLSIFMVICTGMEEKHSELVEFDIYPNPSSGLFHIKSAFTGSIHVFDSQGKLVHQQTIEDLQPNLLRLSDLTDGIYFLQVKHSSGLINKKIILSKD